MTGLAVDGEVIPEDLPHFDPEDDRGLYPGGSLPLVDPEWQLMWPESIDPDDLPYLDRQAYYDQAVDFDEEAWPWQS